MAQFTAQGCLKLLFNGDGMSVGFTDAPSINPLQVHKRKLSLLGSTNSRVLASSVSSSSSSKSPSPNKHKQLSSNKSPSVGDYGDILDEPDFERDELSCFRGLVLDISYRPVKVVCWKRAICLEFTEKADVLEYYDQTVNSPSGSFYIPAVLRVPHLLQVVKRRRIINSLTRKNILARDSFFCQYCYSTENLTIDHVLPISRGGEWTWENLVTACWSCNLRKGQKTVEEANMKLIKVPKVPKDYDKLTIPLTSSAIKMLIRRKGTPEEWLQYLSKPFSDP